MDVSNKKLFRSRDIIVIHIFLVLIFFAANYNNYQYTLSPSWYKNTKQRNRDRDMDYYVKPVVGDLDGDGMNEIVIVTKELELQILSVESSTREGSFEPEILASISMYEFSVLKGKYPFDLQIGYVDPYSPSSSRSQVIVVITEDFTVRCYDHLLTLIWEKHIAHNTYDTDKIIDSFKPYEIILYPSSLQLQKDGRNASGTIFVGASMRLETSVNDLEQVSSSQNTTTLGWKDYESSASGSTTYSDVRSQLEHFNIYALDAKTGHIIWRHDGLDIKLEQYTKSLPQSSMFKLELRDLMSKSHHGGGLSDWTLFRESLISQLPHRWREMGDTHFAISSFLPKHIGSKLKTDQKIVDHKSKFPSKQSRFKGIFNNPVPFSAFLPHDSSEHISQPNVLVAHTSRGVEVVSLSTGAAITSLALGVDDTYADIDGDYVVDTVVLLESAATARIQSSEFADPGRSFQHCTLMVVSGLPARSQLFNGTICSGRGSLQDQLHRQRADTQLPELVSSAAPAIIRTTDENTDTESKNVVVAVNTGVATCYSGSGKLKWQIKDSPKWDTDFTKAFVQPLDIDSKRVLDKGSHDSSDVDVLIVGQNSMKIYSSTGEFLTSIEIPESVVTKPVLGDFDSDGVTDIILVTENSIMGYRLEVTESTNIFFIVLIVLSVVTILVFVASMKTDAIAGTSKSSVLSIIRSTDNLHTD